MTIDTAKLRSLLGKATIAGTGWYTIADDETLGWQENTGQLFKCEIPEDANLIVEMRNALPELLDELDYLRKAHVALRRELDDIKATEF